MLQLDSFSAEVSLYRSSHARAVFGLILREIPDSSWEGIWIRVIYVSLRDTFHVFVIWRSGYDRSDTGMKDS